MQKHASYIFSGCHLLTGNLWKCLALLNSPASNQVITDHSATAQNDGAETEQLFKYILKPPPTTTTTITSNTKHTSGGWPVMGSSALTGPEGAQLPCTQQSVNSSAQTNSQSSGLAGRACVLVCVCVWRGCKRGKLLVKRPPRLCKLFRLRTPNLPAS